MAEMLYIGKNDDQVRQGAENDLQSITAPCRAAISESDKPEEWRQNPEMETHMLMAVFAGAETLLKDNWSSVEAMAENLTIKKELSYTEATKIAEKNGLKLFQKEA